MSSFGRAYTKIGTIQRRLAWPLCKDDTQNLRSVSNFFLPTMNSLDWRLKRLENKVVGPIANLGPNSLASVDLPDEHIIDQLETVAKHYRSYVDGAGKNYPRFLELYGKYRDQLHNSCDGNQAELVLAYEKDLLKYFRDIEVMAEKAEQVLNIEKWPDLSDYQERLDKLTKITKEQHLQSVKLDKRTEELIEIYNDIIGSFKSNMVIWNEKLEAHESVDKKADEDE